MTSRSARSELIAGNPAALAAAAADSAAVDRDRQQQQDEQQHQQEDEGDQQVSFAVAHGLAAAEKEYLAHQIAALRISLAKRDAEVARLEGKNYGSTNVTQSFFVAGLALRNKAAVSNAKQHLTSWLLSHDAPLQQLHGHLVMQNALDHSCVIRLCCFNIEIMSECHIVWLLQDHWLKQ